MSKRLASIIITAKNEEKHIEQCLMSLKYQTYKNMEIIVSDAESKDKTVKIAKKYADKVIVKKSNIAEGRNIGAAAARGEILFFLDADTILMPDTIEKMMGGFKNKKVVGGSCQALPLTADPKYVMIYLFHNRWSKTSIIFGQPNIAGFFCGYRKEAFDKVGGFNPYMGVPYEDYDMSKRMSKLGKIFFSESTLVLTSHRRLKEWGIRSTDRYVRSWAKWAITGKGFDYKWYNPIR